MATCLFDLNRERFSPFICDTLSATAFSGNGTHRNNPDSGGVKDNGSIPGGTYYIVDRESGGTIGPILDWIRDKDEWFALYRDDGTIDDQTFVGHVRRGEFRLHPKGPRGLSLGCITLEYQKEFNSVRTYLLGQPVAYIPSTKTRTYGTVWVSASEVVPMLDPRFRRGNGSAMA